METDGNRDVILRSYQKFAGLQVLRTRVYQSTNEVFERIV